MARQFLTPRLNRLYRDATESLINDFSKRSSVVLVQVDWQSCPNCVIDSRDNTSTGVYNGTGPEPFEGNTCPVCHGNGKISAEKQTKLPANVQWGPTTRENPMTPLGQLEEGQARIKTLYRYHETLANLKDEDYFLVDGKRCKMDGEPKPRGLQNYVSTTFIVHVDK